MCIASPGTVRNPDFYHWRINFGSPRSYRKEQLLYLYPCCPEELLSLQHILFRQAEIPVAADDQVVVDRQVEALAGLHQGPGQFLVGGGRLQVAAGVVVHQNEAGGLVFQGQLQDLPGIDHRLVHRAFLDDLLGDDFILAVEEDHPELLVQAGPPWRPGSIPPGCPGT